jgi:CDP-glucose 4,6-dehydratase
MEEVELTMDGVNPDFWHGRRVFLTGHTGFKGGWLSLWLQSMGAKLFGFALTPPTTPALFYECSVADTMTSTIGDLRDYGALQRAIESARPEIVFHMAAQPLVRYSYQAPLETYAVNVMGTVHVLEAVRQISDIRAVVNITSDKCYDNREWVWGYREDEAMGGHDPYSNSKGCSELITSAYRRSFFRKGRVALASARAGNVIGGGDWATDRLVPDTLKAFEKGQPVIIRNPSATRPWQHVLEPLSGYLLLAERLYSGGHQWAEGWNFGPRDEDARSVGWIVERMIGEWGGAASWQKDDDEWLVHEANMLKLDISKARFRLGWNPTWEIETALRRSVEWHKAWLRKSDMREKSLEEIRQFMIQDRAQ